MAHGQGVAAPYQCGTVSLVYLSSHSRRMIDCTHAGADVHRCSHFSQLSGARIGNKKVIFSCETTSPWLQYHDCLCTVKIMPVHMVVLKVWEKRWNQATLVDHVGNVTW